MDQEDFDREFSRFKVCFQAFTGPVIFCTGILSGGRPCSWVSKTSYDLVELLTFAMNHNALQHG